MTTLSDRAGFIWSPLPVSLCLCAFLTSLIKPILWLQLFHRQKPGRVYGRGSVCVGGKDCSVQFSHVRLFATP